jgi:hypothetical protein
MQTASETLKLLHEELEALHIFADRKRDGLTKQVASVCLKHVASIQNACNRRPCGECHLSAGETCDICGALAAPKST